MPETPPEPTPTLIGAALREGAAHLSILMRLARTETDLNIRTLVSLIGIVGVIPVLLIVVVFLGLDAVVKLLAIPLGSEAPAALIVALPFLSAAAALGWLGARRMALSNLEPWRSWRRAGRTAQGPTRPGRASR